VRRSMGEGRFVKQTCCPGHFGHVILAVEPAETDIPFQVCWEAEDAQIPQGFAGVVTEGLLQALAEARWQAGLRVHIIGGSYHPVDSLPSDYREAARRAMHQALERCAAP
jgi:elongation factor G